MILTAVLALASLGMLAGLGLGLAARVFAVKIDPRVEQIDTILPQYNCGACGYAGCADFAKAVVDGEDTGLCAPGGPDTSAKVAEIMGAEVTEKAKMVAFVLCGGNDTLAVKKYIYNGVADCKSADLVSGGDKACSYGCLGLGSCVLACRFDAIVIEDGLARILPDECTGCRACVSTCPKNIIKMVPAARAVHVVCSSKDKGPVVRKACKVGCIGCRRCTKEMANEEIVMDDTLAVVDYDKPLQSDAAANLCPTKCIKVIESEFTDSMIAQEPEEAAVAEEGQA